LRGWQCEALTAQSGMEARQLLAAVGDIPDIVLADYHLDGSTGLEAIAGLRDIIGENVPVIVITADASAEVSREVRSHGHPLLRKPVKAAALRALMHQLTWQRATAAE
jgi:CheY-like chemotaxis protein